MMTSTTTLRQEAASFCVPRAATVSTAGLLPAGAVIPTLLLLVLVLARILAAARIADADFGALLGLLSVGRLVGAAAVVACFAGGAGGADCWLCGALAGESVKSITSFFLCIVGVGDGSFPCNRSATTTSSRRLFWWWRFGGGSGPDSWPHPRCQEPLALEDLALLGGRRLVRRHQSALYVEYYDNKRVDNLLSY